MILTDGRYARTVDEQTFKMLYLRNNMKDWFCIETEETCAGFPDVMTIRKEEYKNIASFYEFKYARNGKIHFQPTQPAFYRKHAGMGVKVIAWNRDTNKVHQFPVEWLFEEGNPYCIHEDGSVNLKAVEEWNYEGTCSQSGELPEG